MQNLNISGGGSTPAPAKYKEMVSKFDFIYHTLWVGEGCTTLHGCQRGVPPAGAGLQNLNISGGGSTPAPGKYKEVVRDICLPLVWGLLPGSSQKVYSYSDDYFIKTPGPLLLLKDR